MVYGKYLGLLLVLIKASWLPSLSGRWGIYLLGCVWSDLNSFGPLEVFYLFVCFQTGTLRELGSPLGCGHDLLEIMLVFVQDFIGQC